MRLEPEVGDRPLLAQDDVLLGVCLHREGLDLSVAHLQVLDHDVTHLSILNLDANLLFDRRSDACYGVYEVIVLNHVSQDPSYDLASQLSQLPPSKLLAEHFFVLARLGDQLLHRLDGDAKIFGDVGHHQVLDQHLVHHLDLLAEGDLGPPLALLPLAARCLLLEVVLHAEVSLTLPAEVALVSSGRELTNGLQFRL